ncbi:hypothetical protein E3N88_36038 [Mikania micrantha]|uniref:Uncharacterized protein n=1 Tax=Mikania micrantha TaxID=192012 RepID=A0A5N6M302_9ASTR|nr:hypothetical protein E3N88_36038 [Mikania micrantha]
MYRSGSGIGAGDDQNVGELGGEESEVKEDEKEGNSSLYLNDVSPIGAKIGFHRGVSPVFPMFSTLPPHRRSNRFRLLSFGPRNGLAEGLIGPGDLAGHRPVLAMLVSFLVREVKSIGEALNLRVETGSMK